MARGGVRPGSGRKKGFHFPHTVRAEEAKKFAVDKVVKKLNQLMEVQFEMALGDYYFEEVLGMSGKKKIYKGKPNLAAVTSLIEFAFGKPKQQIDNKMSGSIESPGLSTLAEGVKALLEKKIRTSSPKNTQSTIKKEEVKPIVVSPTTTATMPTVQTTEQVKPTEAPQVQGQIPLLDPTKILTK